MLKTIKTSTKDLTKGPLSKQIVSMTVPMIFGSLGTMVFNLVDTFFIGHLGTKQLAAISFTFPVIMVIMSVSIGLGTGATSLISNAIGEKRHDKVKNLTTQSLLLALIVVAILAVIGLLTIDPVFTLIGAKGELLKMVKDYMTIWYIGVVVVIVPMIGNSAIRSTGDTKFPSIIMLISMTINIILDPIFIFGLFGFPRLELKGAALATVIARSVTLVFSLWLLYKKLDMLTFSIPSLKEMWNNWKRLLYIGLPASATNLVFPISMGVVTALIAQQGAEAVAAYGVAGRLQGFLLVVVMALGISLGPVTGQNWGAERYDRIISAAKLSLRFVVVWGLFIWVLMIFLSKPLAALFNDNPTVVNIVALYYWVVAWSFGFRGALRISTTMLNIINKPIDSAILNVIQSLVLLIPLAFLGNYLFGLVGIFGALVISNLITGTAGYGWLMKILKEKEKEARANVI
jgi:putative MATE family efflux protein